MMKKTLLTLMIIINISATNVLGVSAAVQNNDTTSISSKTVSNNQLELKLGNTYSNISNCGSLVQDNEWHYYVKENKVYRIKNDGSDEKQILSDNNGKSDYDCLNIKDGWIYYRKLNKDENGKYAANNEAICKARIDGSEETEIVHGEFSPCIEVIGDWIYYMKLYDGDGNGRFKDAMCKIKIDGSEQKEILPYISGNSYGKFNVTGDSIYYKKYFSDGNSRMKEAIYKCNIDGTNQKEITSDYSFGDMILDGDWIYCEKGNNLCKIKTDGSQESIILKYNGESFFDINLADNWIYYYKGTNIYKIKTDGTSETLLVPNVICNRILGIAGDWIYYNNALSSTSGFDRNYEIDRTKKDGSLSNVLSK